MSALAQGWEFLTTAAHWTGPTGILALLWNHVRLAAMATGAAAAIAIPAGVIIGRRGRGGAAAVAVVNIGRALPSFAVLVLAFGIFSQWGRGLTIWPTFVALVLLAVPPMFTNAFTGIQGVDRDITESAVGMGMRSREVLWRVQTPIAIPLIITGVRVSAVQVVATATLGAWVGYQDLGTLIYEGFAQRDDGKILAGAVLVAALSILTEVAFSSLERVVAPWEHRRTRRVPAAPSVSTTTEGVELSPGKATP